MADDRILIADSTGDDPKVVLLDQKIQANKDALLNERVGKVLDIIEHFEDIYYMVSRSGGLNRNGELEPISLSDEDVQTISTAAKTLLDEVEIFKALKDFEADENGMISIYVY